jgi:superfamily I DNA and/or RNA helicase
MANQEFDVVIIDEATQAIEAVSGQKKSLSHSN